MVWIPSAEALVPTKGYDVTYYRADVNLNKVENTINGKVLMKANSDADAGLQQIVQHAKFLTIDSVKVNGTLASIQWLDTASGTYNVTGFPLISPTTSFTLETFYHGIGQTEGGSFPWGGVTNVKGKLPVDSNWMMFAMGVGFSAPYVSTTRHWLPCYDLPDDKADSLDFYFTTREDDITASNGRLISNTTANGERTMHWKIEHPIASYLLTFAVGPFERVLIQNPNNIPFELYAFKPDTAKAAGAMRYKVVDALHYFDSLFSPYPFEKVGYVLAPIGSMEHQTIITLVFEGIDSSKSNTTAAHELAHMWWGDWVTCKTFDDPWLNEGLATYSESLILERFYSEKDYWDKQHANVKGALTTSLPLFGGPALTSPRNNYPTNLIYQKGAAFFGMLRYYLGDSLFFHGLRTYGTRHAYSTATSYDLWNDFQEATGKDLGWMFKTYVFRGSHPVVKAWYSLNGTSASLTFNQTQQTKFGFFRLPIIVEATDVSGNTERQQIWMDSSLTSTATATFSITPTSIKLDPDGAVIMRLTGLTLGVKDEQAATQGFQIQLLPNPVRNGLLTIKVSGRSEQQNVSLEIVSTTGAVLKQTSLSLQSSNEVQTAMDTTGIPSGAYTLVLKSEGQILASELFSIAR